MNYEKEQATYMSILIKIIMALGGLLLGFIICRIIITPYTVSDTSMEPGLKSGDRLLILKHITPATGERVLIQSPVEPGRVLLKRIVAMEGDTVEIRNKILYINNAKYNFTWKVKSSTQSFPMTFTFRDNMPALKVKRNQYFLLGDNLDQSFDSRSFGLVDNDLIIGRILYIF